MDELEIKYERLKGEIKRLGKVVVAFSGGVDSTFLLDTAVKVLGEHCLAVAVDSPFVKRDSLESAYAFARLRGVRLETLKWDALSCQEVALNGPDRCYYCKKEMFSLIKRLARDLGFHGVIEGTNREDENDFRPGLRALKELNVISPLNLCGFYKDEIRTLSVRHGIPGWDRPAESCLATRFPFGRSITPEGLVQVERAEAYLRALGFAQCRVRHHGDVARIELPEREMMRFLETAKKEKVFDRFREMGFLFTALDLRGYERGSMNAYVLDRG